jgi:hypothetical protein
MHIFLSDENQQTMEKTLRSILISISVLAFIFFTKPVKAQDDNTNNHDCYPATVCFDWEHATWHQVGDGGYWTDPLGFGQVVYDPGPYGTCLISSTGWCMINYPGYSSISELGGAPTAFVTIPIPLEIIPPPCSNPPCLSQPTPQPTPQPTAQPSGRCPGAQVVLGQISANAKKIAPPFPLVVGQDPSKRGVDLTFSLSIQPTILHSWSWGIVDVTQSCNYDENGGHSGCPISQYSNGWSRYWESSSYRYVETNTIWGCIEHITSYKEGVSVIFPSANLANSSKSWILNDLAQRYPGAFLHHPNWSWGYAGPGYGSFSGFTYLWNFSIQKVQAADPGIYNLVVSGTTSGTPVSQPRSFSIKAGTFDDYLLETTIIH